MSQSTWSWVVVGDSSGARIFKFDRQGDAWSLVEKIDGNGTANSNGTSDFGPKASEHKGALHGHGNIENVRKETTERRFAHLLAHVLERGLTENSFGRLILVAQPKLLGELRENLSRGLKAKIVAEVSKDYVHLTGNEIREQLIESIPPDLVLRA
jgi:protein required for attachment to host cells